MPKSTHHHNWYSCCTCAHPNPPLSTALRSPKLEHAGLAPPMWPRQVQLQLLGSQLLRGGLQWGQGSGQ